MVDASIPAEEEDLRGRRFGRRRPSARHAVTRRHDDNIQYNRHEFSWVEGSFTAWYIAFMVWSLILLVVRVYIAGFVHKFFNALQSVGDDRAKELGEHSNYDQKCVVVP